VSIYPVEKPLKLINSVIRRVLWCISEGDVFSKVKVPKLVPEMRVVTQANLEPFQIRILENMRPFFDR
jgi:hypothetical protein